MINLQIAAGLLTDVKVIPTKNQTEIILFTIMVREARYDFKEKKMAYTTCWLKAKAYGITGQRIKDTPDQTFITCIGRAEVTKLEDKETGKARYEQRFVAEDFTDPMKVVGILNGFKNGDRQQHSEQSGAPEQAPSWGGSAQDTTQQGDLPW